MNSQKFLLFFLAAMAISAALVTSRVVVHEAKVPHILQVPPLDPADCYGLCSNLFKDAECLASCKAKNYNRGGGSAFP
ncbi:hypothetical protein TB2_010249 [Malus domestica]